MVHCQACGTDIPYDREYAIEEGDLECVVEFKYNPDDHLAVQETETFCSPECFVEKYGR